MSLKKLIVLRVFASDYHSGQLSRGYKIVCQTYLRLKAKGIDRIEDAQWHAARRTALYKQLKENYANKM